MSEPPPLPPPLPMPTFESTTSDADTTANTIIAAALMELENQDENTQQQEQQQQEEEQNQPNEQPNDQQNDPSTTLGGQYSYYALRRGKFGLKSCIFLNWKDCQNFIKNDYDNTNNGTNNSTSHNIHQEEFEFAPFDKFDEAVTYLLAGGENDDDDNVNREEDEEEEDVTMEEDESNNNIISKKRKFNATNNHKQVAFISPFSHHTSTTTTTTSTTTQSSSSSSLPSRRGVRVKAEANPNRKPTKAWEKMYQRYVNYVNEKGTNDVDVSSKEHVDLLRWTRQQQHEYRYLKEGRASSMFQVKIEKLQSIGFEFKYVSVST